MHEMEKRTVVMIPAHMKSVRFPGKILCEIHGLPMIEHVRRRCLLARSANDVFVATCDRQIASTVESGGGVVIWTSDTHKNGTSRVREALDEVKADNVILVQGDEPLILPEYIDAMSDALSSQHGSVWNATGPIQSPDELDRHSFVKCAVSQNDRIISCFRRSPSHASFAIQQRYIRKILGLIAFRVETLKLGLEMSPTFIEENEFIEQMRFIENKFDVYSVPLAESVPSINEPAELDQVMEFFENSIKQRELLELITAG